MRQDVYAMHHMALVHTKSSKTDPFRAGVSIRKAATSHIICPVRWLRAYLQSRRGSYGPLFRFHSGRFLIRNDIVKLIKSSLGEINLNTHSLRAGGATNLANLGSSRLRDTDSGQVAQRCIQELCTFFRCLHQPIAYGNGDTKVGKPKAVGYSQSAISRLHRGGLTMAPTGLVRPAR